MERKLYRLFPAVLFVGVFFVYAILYSLWQSIGLNPIIGESQFTLSYYQQIFQSDFINSFVYTVYIALVSSLLAFCFAVVILFFLSLFINSVWIEYIFHIIRFPILVPYLIASYMIFILLMDNGALEKLLFLLTRQRISFSEIINDKEGRGIIITYLWKTTPFFIMMAFPILKRISGTWNELVYLFNLTKLQFFLKIALPLMLPSLMMSSFIVITYIFSAFEVPYILGTLTPKTLPIFVYNIYAQGDLEQRPYLMAINIILTFFSISISFLMYSFYMRIEKHLKGWY